MITDAEMSTKRARVSLRTALALLRARRGSFGSTLKRVFGSRRHALTGRCPESGQCGAARPRSRQTELTAGVCVSSPPRILPIGQLLKDLTIESGTAEK
jgi:hypothetical protein